jgi:hypothetical protein
MSASVLKFSFAPYLARWPKQVIPHSVMAHYISIWLDRAAETLSTRDLVFEASEAEEMAVKFEEYHENDGSPEGFVSLWQDFEDWAGGVVTFASRERELCSVPQLPAFLQC